MRIAMISDWFSENMGYGENCLPKAVASLGHEVHLITSNAQVYFNSPRYRETYEPFLGPPVVECGVKALDGYTLHRLPFKPSKWGLRICGLIGKLRSLRPQIVQVFHPVSQIARDVALVKPLLGYKLFTANHVHASVFPLINDWVVVGRAWRLKYTLSTFVPGRCVSWLTTKCYPIAVDAAEIAVRFYGVQPEKICVSPLAVDTDHFSPAADDVSRRASLELRRRLGFADSEIVCVYTGRFSEDKDPLCLARAVAVLAERGECFRGLFVGNGPQESAIRASAGCVVHPFVLFGDLPPFYRAADIGVWPRQESTSMLDAAASGIPIVISDSVQAVERVQGNGLTFKEGDSGDLMRSLLALREPDRRKQLGDVGAEKMLNHYSWVSVARSKIEDYEAALRSYCNDRNAKLCAQGSH